MPSTLRIFQALLVSASFLTTQVSLAQNNYPDSSKIEIKGTNAELEEVVISGNLKETSKSDSPISIEVYRADFFKKNPTPSLFDALQTINGVRPQLNCNICNTGDIHINGLEGPYTMILIDGMPIVSGLSTVYGLSGIPTALIDRIEVVKGPASTLYGSEAVGGLINVITKSTSKTPIVAADVFGTSWGELNIDYASKVKVGKRAQSLIGLNGFFYNTPIDNNKDGFTDVTLQNRFSLFNKWNLARKDNRLFNLAARYVYEDRWGGQMNWSRKYRGGEEIYGESVYTNRAELFGVYQLPVKEKIDFQFSANHHDQNSVYGNMWYKAQQTVAFGQLVWYKTWKRHDLLSGVTYRFTRYDDNTPATADGTNLLINRASFVHLPGLFVQDEFSITDQHKLLGGLRFDYNSNHGPILSPRLNYKWNSASKNTVIRMGIGNGYRVAHVFTEDHAALTGARTVIFKDQLRPEQSWNGNLNVVQKFFIGNTVLNLDGSAFYTYFTNKIIPDYDTNPNQIIYDNLKGYSISQGVSLNMELRLPFGLNALVGATLMNVYNKDEGIVSRQLFTERFTGTWNISYVITKSNTRIDYTGNVYSPMRLPLLNKLDPRPEYSPWWSIQNIQITQSIGKKWEIYAGVKNLLNWTPNKGIPFLIARVNDPFDHNVSFDADGQAMATNDNPYGLTFDPSYMYAPNQGIRGFIGVRFTLK